MIDQYLILLIISISVASANLFFGLIRTYYARYSKKTYDGSVKYWESWQKRKFDVAVQVLKEIGIETPEDLKKLSRKLKKESKKSRNLK